MKHIIVVKTKKGEPLPHFVNHFYVGLTESKELGGIKDFTWEVKEDD